MSLAARLSGIQELLQAVSQKTNVAILVSWKIIYWQICQLKEDLKSVTEDKVVNSLNCCWLEDG